MKSAAGENPPEHRAVRRVSSEYEDVDAIMMERNVVHEVEEESDEDEMIYEEVMEDGEYEAVDHEAPQPQNQTPDVMRFNINVAYAVV